MPSSSAQSGERDTEARATKVMDHPPLGKIGFIGLGRMGAVMAANLAAAGHLVNAYVRTPDRLKELQALGVAPSLNLPDLFDCEIIISILPDDNAVRAAFFGSQDTTGLADHLAPGTIHLSMSTISTAASAEFTHQHQRRGQGYVAAPVFGNPDAARARQLFVVLAGASIHAERCRPLTDVLGRTIVVGTDPTQANLIKLLGNMMTATSLEVLAELTTVLRKRGHDPQSFVDVMTSTMFDGRVHRTYGSKIVNGNYAPGFVMPLALKDVRLALAEAEKAGVSLPSVGVVHDRLIAGIARGHEQLDWTALGLVASEDAGIG